MITIGLEVEPGEVAYVESGGRCYAILCAPEDSDSAPRHLEARRAPRQLEDRPSEIMTWQLAPSLRIEEIGEGVWGVYDGSTLSGLGK